MIPMYILSAVIIMCHIYMAIKNKNEKRAVFLCLFGIVAQLVIDIALFFIVFINFI